MKRYKLLLVLALSLLVFWPLGAIEADTANQLPEPANQSEQASAAVVTDSSDSGAGARDTPSQDSQIAAKALTVSDAPAVAATETTASTQEGNTGNLVEDSAKPVTAQPAEVLSAANQTQDQVASDAPSASKRVRELVEDMTLRQKITQMLMPDFRKWQQEGQASQSDMTELNKEVAEAVDKYDFGGVILFAENVKGMMTLGKGEVLKQIIEDFSSAGYTVTAHLVNARDYGVPQSRERVFLVGVHKEKIENRFGYHYELPLPTHGDPTEIDLLSEKLPWVTLKQAIGDLENDPGEYFEGSYSTIYMSRNRKKTWTDQSFTIQASGRQAPQHPGGSPMTQYVDEEDGRKRWKFTGENRRLSIKEIARIQTFPDWFKFSAGSPIGKSGKEISRKAQIDKVYKQIGNAVPVLLARAIVQPIADFLNSHLSDIREK